MFDIGSSELLLIIVVAVVVIGPKDLPRVLYKLGQYVAKGRAMTRHFRAGIDEMVRHAELEEMEKKWAAQNARIIAQSTAAEGETRPEAERVVDAVDPASSATEPSEPDHAAAAPAGATKTGDTRA